MRNRTSKPVFDTESVKRMVSSSGIQMDDVQVKQLCKELEHHYRESSRDVISFDHLKACSHMDIEKYRDAYWHMFDMNGAVVSHTIGFNFSMNDPEFPEDDEPTGTREYIREMIETFKPVQIWTGTKYLQERIEEMGFTAQLFPYFQDGGFMVILKMPIFRPG